MNADPDSQSILINVIILIVLTLLNAFFAEKHKKPKQS